LSKLHKAGKALLESAGWRKAGRNCNLIPAFSWTVRQGGDLSVFHDIPPPPVRQVKETKTHVYQIILL
jgi:hypothetical protein